MATGSAREYADQVTAREKEVLGEALRLTAKQRARLAAELLASLETDNAEQVEQIEKAWSDEIARRAKRASSGKSVGTDWAVVRDRLLKSPRRKT